MTFLASCVDCVGPISTFPDREGADAFCARHNGMYKPAHHTVVADQLAAAEQVPA